MKDTWDKQTALNKAARFCAYQERSPHEVRQKLAARIHSSEIIDSIIDELIDDGFIHTGRFLTSFIRGKFNAKKWGRIKIAHALRIHEINDQEIQLAMDRLIPEHAYREVVRDLMLQKINKTEGLAPLAVKGKVFRYLAGKGYEQDIIYEVWNDIGHDV